MDKKPAFVYILIGLWITIGVLFLVMLVIHTTYLTDQIASYRESSFGESNFTTGLIFNLIVHFLLFLFIVICSFILSYGTFMKKSWSWLFGTTLSSFLAFYIFEGIQSIGFYLITGYFGKIFSNLYTGFQSILYILLIFLIPSLLFIFTRHYVKTYFKKREQIKLTST